MPALALTFLAMSVLSSLAAVVGVALNFNGFAYFVAIVVILVLVSFTDRERFYGTSPRPR